MIEGLDEKYTNTGLYIIAFFDILGTKEKVKDNLTETLEQLWLINHFIRKEIYNQTDIIFRTFSDNYFIAIETSRDNIAVNFNRIANIIGNLHSRCLRMYNVLLRGAITYGEMHIDKYSNLGDALIKGYQMEQKDAIYPRILVDKALINTDKVNYRNFKEPIFEDSDSQICLNTLMFFPENMVECVNKHLICNLTTQLEKIENKDNKIKNKIKWICDYANEYYLQNYGLSLLDC